MGTKTESKISIDNLIYLPSYAQYLLDHKLKDFVRVQINIIQELDIPLMKFLSHLSEEELFQFSLKTTTEYLEFLAQNKASELINTSIDRWLTNQLPLIKKEDIAAEDITQVSYLRKKSLLFFIPDYCSELEQALEMVREIDLFLLVYETKLTNTRINVLKESINEHALFIEKIANTSPGIIYVFDIANEKDVYANKSIAEFIGYDKEVAQKIHNPIKTLIHSDDSEAIHEFEKNFQSTKDAEIRSIKIRLKNSEGVYQWLRVYETVFKRNSDGIITQKIGIIIDIHKQKITSEQLEKREKELLEAQELAHIGSFSWNINNSNSYGSPETFKILEVGPDDFVSFINNVHPDDKEKVEQAIENSFQTGLYECTFKYRSRQNEKIIWSKARVSYKDGKPDCMTGTIMDVTEQRQMLSQLQESQELYKQAQTLAHIGNWSWDIIKNKVEWSDELYEIYEIEKNKEIDFESYTNLLYPEDKQMVIDIIEKSLSNHQPYEFYHRIKTENDTIKFLHSRGDVHLNKEGNPYKLIGTAQDVTERQNLILKLQESESLYKQAQALAKMGNFTWNVITDEVFWSDEVYNIYEIPLGQPVIFQTAFAPIIPSHKEKVQQAIEQTLTTRKGKSISYAIKLKNDKIKYINLETEVITNDKDEITEVLGTAQDVTERQLLIEQLQETQRLHQQAQSLTQMGNWVVDIKTLIYNWSDQIYDIYEIEKGKEFTAKEWETYIHPEDKEGVLNYFQECIDQKKSYDKVHRIVLPDGRIKTIHRKGEFILDDKGEPVKMIGTTQDVTEQYRVQQALEENQKFIRKIADATPSIIASYNINTGKYTFISEGLTKMLGYDVKEVIDKGVEFFVTIIHPDDLPALIEKNTKAMEEASLPDNIHKNDIMEFRYRMRHMNGEYKWFHTYGTVFDRNAEGKVEHILNISLDVTEQVEADKKILEQQFFIEQVADASPTILYLFDIDKNSISYINREIYFVLGYTTAEIEEMKGEVVKNLYHPDDYFLLPERRESDKKFQHRNSMMQYECRVKSKDGNWKWLLVREIIFKSDDNNPVQILGAALDISNRKEMEKSLLQNSFQLEQSNASLEEFAYVASHDLKEPLRKISTFGDRLVNTQADNLTSDGKIYLNKIIDASQRMQTMITDLLSISMISGDRSFTSYSLQSILDDALQALEYKIEEKDAIINAKDLPEAKIVPSQFRQLFQNLIGNSLKFSKEEVQPVIKISHNFLKPSEVDDLQLVKSNKYLKLIFQDNGIGFEEEFAGKIFQIFQRLHGRSEYEGTGIGLAICKKIVEHHGGIIYASGVPKEGATFNIVLPV